MLLNSFIFRFSAVSYIVVVFLLLLFSCRFDNQNILNRMYDVVQTAF